MCKLSDVERFSLNDVAERLGVHLSTVWRWAINGVRGRQLPTRWVGGRRYVTAADLDRFLGDPADADHQSPARTESADAATRLLDAHGIKRK